MSNWFWFLWPILCFILGILITLNWAKIEQKKIDDSVYKELQFLEERKTQLQNDTFLLEQNAEHIADVFYKENMDIAQRRFAEDLEIEEERYQAYLEYLKQVEKESLDDFQRDMRIQSQDLSKATTQVRDLQAIITDIQKRIDCAVEVEKRMQMERDQKNFYRCSISEIDQEEIIKIRSIEPFLRNKEPLNKVIWSVYYQKPFTDLIGRVIGTEKKTGIYKITNLESGMCYIGQAVDIASRWRQHVKRGIGAEPGGNNKLYMTMLEIGVENFTFEIIEECESELLNEREDYWQNFFHAKDFGYSIK